MNKFILLFRATEAAQEEAIGTPERAQKALQGWMKWIQSLEAGGHLASRGSSLERRGKVVRADKTVTDGPYIEVKDLVLGYIVVQTQDLDAAVELAGRCPIVLGGGGSVEVRAIWEGVA
jgi:hypothetical protein